MGPAARARPLPMAMARKQGQVDAQVRKLAVPLEKYPRWTAAARGENPRTMPSALTSVAPSLDDRA